MSNTLDLLIMLPVLLPLLLGAVLVLLGGRPALKFALNLGGTLALLVLALTLYWLTDHEIWPGGVGVYLAGNWVAPFGITMVVDRLTALIYCWPH